MKRLVLPRQHGAWVMVALPFLIGMTAGRPHWIHLFLFPGWFFLYISSSPLLLFVKKKKNRGMYVKGFAAYTSIAMLFLSVPLLFYPELLLFAGFLLPMLGINIIFARRKNERAFLNDLFAIMGLCLGGPAAYLIGSGTWEETALYIWAASVGFFIGSVFFVKMFIREKNNSTFKWYAWAYHSLLVILSFVFGFIGLGAAYLFSFFRIFLFYKKPLQPKHTAIIECSNSVYFFIVMIFWLV
ncbi:YwiC-like family protein [Salibacterium aidingense]|uniref:YwiC-like family protein n=1 Tax=Salibacterium aidingense TaxID=384933 RepID=UPI0003F71739|nr:YwiC-like family protein [Salibacterium aidingense]